MILHAALSPLPKPGLALDLRFGLIGNREQFNDYHSIGLADDIEREPPTFTKRRSNIRLEVCTRRFASSILRSASAAHGVPTCGTRMTRATLTTMPPSRRSFSGTAISLSSTASSGPSRRRISMVFPRLAWSWTSRGRSWNTFRRWNRCLFAAPARRPRSMRFDSHGR